MTFEWLDSNGDGPRRKFLIGRILGSDSVDNCIGSVPLNNFTSSQLYGMRRRIPQSYAFEYQIAPGFEIRSQTRWNMRKVILALAIGALILYLATLTTKSRSLLFTRDVPRNTGWNPQAEKSPGKTGWNTQQYDDRNQWDWQNMRNDDRNRMNRRNLRNRENDTRNHEPIGRWNRGQEPKRRRRRLTKREKNEILNRFEHRCAECRVQLSDFNVDFDHIIPHSYGDIFGDRVDDLSNFEPLCLICHRKKTLAERRTPEYRSMLKRRRQKIRR